MQMTEGLTPSQGALNFWFVEEVTREDQRIWVVTVGEIDSGLCLEWEYKGQGEESGVEEVK